MIVKEYRIPLPLDEDQYNRGCLYMTARAALEDFDARKGNAIETIENKPYEKDGEQGQYTDKIFHVQDMAPAWLRPLLPKKAREVREVCYNGGAHVVTWYECKFFSQFNVKCETIFTPGGPHDIPGLFSEDNAIVDIIDIAGEKLDKKHYDPKYDPTQIGSEKAGIQPLKARFWELPEYSHLPMITARKMVTVHIKFPFQRKIEKTAQGMFREMFLKYQQKLYCWTDDWFNMNMDDIRKYEDYVAEEVEKMMSNFDADGNKIK